MRMLKPTARLFSGQRGFTVIELMASLVITSSMFIAVTSLFVTTTRNSHDNSVIAEADEQARSLLDFIAYDVRMAGSGMPLGQASFVIGNVALGTAPLPVLLTSTTSSIVVRVNETGKNTVLSANYTPSSTTLSFPVVSASDLPVGSVVYLSDMLRGGTQAMRATITGISGNSISVNSSYIASAGAVFTAGSSVTRVTDITYDSPSNNSGITRNNGSGAVVLMPKSTLVITYLDGNGATITPPLTNTTVANNLTSVNLRVSVPARTALKNGRSYTAAAQQVVAIRNLNLNR